MRWPPAPPPLIYSIQKSSGKASNPTPFPVGEWRGVFFCFEASWDRAGEVKTKHLTDQNCILKRINRKEFLWPQVPLL